MWSSRPFVRIFILLSLGIICNNYFPFDHIQQWLILTNIAIIVFVILQSTLGKSVYSITKDRIANLFICLTIFLSGLVLGSNMNSTIINDQYDLEQLFFANVREVIKKPYKSIKVEADVIPYIDKNSQNEFGAILYLNDSCADIKYGDVIIFSAQPMIVKGPMNPHEFNYKKYLLKKGITHYAFIKHNNWDKVSEYNESIIKSAAISIRNKILHILGSTGLNKSEFSVASAILLGFDDYMDNDLKSNYMISGSMHILCVSGLHVGIIYLVINLLLGFMNRIKLHTLKPILIILLIWSYAAITGFSPSVRRASLMISIFIIGNQLNRKSNSYNNLAISGTILLVMDPDLLFNPGFQLSFCAVLSIITFYFPLYNTISINNNFLDKVWSITVLSFSAQLGTFPIAIYYFHYFPTWFWISNLFTFPLSFLIVITGILTITFSWLPYMGIALEFLLKLFIRVLNYLIIKIVDIPYSIIDNAYFSLPMVVCIYITLITTYVIFYYGKPRYFKYLLSCLVLMVSLTTYHKYETITQKRFNIYINSKGSFMEGILGTNQIILADSNICNNQSIINFNISNSRAVWTVSDDIIPLSKKDTIFFDGFQKIGSFLLFNDKIIALDIKNTNYCSSAEKLFINYQLIQRPYGYKKHIEYCEPQTVILTSKIGDKRSLEIKQFFTKKEYNVFNIKENGAWISN